MGETASYINVKGKNLGCEKVVELVELSLTGKGFSTDEEFSDISWKFSFSEKPMRTFRS